VGGVVGATRGVEVKAKVVGATVGAEVEVGVIVATRGVGEVIGAIRRVGRPLEEAVKLSTSTTRAVGPPRGVV
jgi:hypothetical protein